MKTVYGDYAGKVFNVILGDSKYCNELQKLYFTIPRECKRKNISDYIQVWNKFLSIEWGGLVGC